IIESYRAISDPIQSFATDFIKPCPDGRVACDEMYELFKEYCKNYNTTPDDRNKFDLSIFKYVKSMKQGEMMRGKKKICAWTGITLTGGLNA
ncbi:MAG: hypothetical protein GX867_08920, partial [Tissierellia bacterium]|nr:hypothetical protein [Tissierellia bacterium]